MPPCSTLHRVSRPSLRPSNRTRRSGDKPRPGASGARLVFWRRGSIRARMRLGEGIDLFRQAEPGASPRFQELSTTGDPFIHDIVMDRVLGRAVRGIIFPIIAAIERLAGDCACLLGSCDALPDKVDARLTGEAKLKSRGIDKKVKCIGLIIKDDFPNPLAVVPNARIRPMFRWLCHCACVLLKG